MTTTRTITLTTYELEQIAALAFAEYDKEVLKMAKRRKKLQDQEKTFADDKIYKHSKERACWFLCIYDRIKSTLDNQE